MPGTSTPVPSADAVLACPLTFNSVNKFAHGHADNFAVGLLYEMAGYGVPVVVVPHCKPQRASHPADDGWCHMDPPDREAAGQRIAQARRRRTRPLAQRWRRTRSLRLPARRGQAGGSSSAIRNGQGASRDLS
jgi:hypothetical protein